MLTAEDILKEKNREMVYVSKDTSLKEAICKMQDERIGSILVKDGGQIIGIFTERDLLYKVTDETFNLESSKITDFMVSNLLCAPHDATLTQLQDILLGKYLRHIIITKDDEYIGIISAGDVTRANLFEHEKTLHSVSFDYYENWKWGKYRKS